MSGGIQNAGFRISSLTKIGSPDSNSAGFNMSGNKQIEMPLPVAVCAWCKPDERGSGVGAVSHGICMRHLRKFRIQLHEKNAKKGPHPAKPHAKRETPSLL
jgi:hypothetical protein